MQGNPFNEKGGGASWEDQGWARMREMLDEQMPERPVVVPPATTAPAGTWQRWGITALLITAGFIIGAALMYWYTNEPAEAPSEQQVQQSITPPIAWNEYGGDAAARPDLDKLVILESEKQPPDQIIPPPELSTTDDIKKNTLLSQKQTFENNSTSTPTLRNTRSKDQLIQPTEFRSGQMPMANQTARAAQPNTAVNNTTFASEGTAVTAQIPAQPTLALLETIPSIPQSAATDASDPIIALAELPRRNPWSFGIEGSMAGQQLTAYDGFRVGATASYQLDRRFSVLGGIQFKRLKKGESKALLALRDEQGFFDYNVGYPGTKNLVGLESAISMYPVRSLDYIALPVLLKFQLNRFWNISTGAELSYLLGVNRDTPSQVGTMDNMSFDPAANAPLAEGQGIPMESFEKVDLSAVAGIGFRLNPHLNLDLRYHYGFRDFTKDEWWGIRQFDNHQYWEWRLSYMF